MMNEHAICLGQKEGLYGKCSLKLPGVERGSMASDQSSCPGQKEGLYDK